jgi:hypothetical protein
MKLDVDVRQFTRALNEYKEATGKDGAEILNRAGRNVAYRAAQGTPKATQARIRRDLYADPRLRYALTSISLRKQGMGFMKTGFAKEVQRFVSRRIASAGFIRSGWAEAIEKLGGTYRGRKIGKGHGRATKATALNLIAEIVNTVPGIEKVGVKALQNAVEFVAADMIDYSQRLLAKRAKAHSP